jgi:hypothetical protein
MGKRLCGWAVGRLCGWAVVRLCGYAVMRLCGYAVVRLCGWAEPQGFTDHSHLLRTRSWQGCLRQHKVYDH